MYKLSFFVVVLWLSLTTNSFSAYAQFPTERIVQINGVLMSADSLRAVPNATVQVIGTERGTYASELGVFSLVALKGDSVLVSALGYKSVALKIPDEVRGKFYSLIQLMVQDTFYLPETIIKPLPRPEEFDYAFKYWQIPDDSYETARKNTNSYTMRALSYTLPRDGRENQAIVQRNEQYNLQYYGVNTRPQQIFSPFAWSEFISAWKRGDFKRQKKR